MAQEPINRLPYANIVELEVDQLTAGSAVISSGTMVLSSLTVGSLAVTSTATIEALTVSSAFTANGTVTLGSNSSDAINAVGTFQGLNSSGITTSTLTVTSSATIAALTVSSNLSAGLSSFASVSVTSGLTVGANAQVLGAFQVDGGTILGVNSSDTVTINAGNVAQPNMPAFFAYNSSTRGNVTGNSTIYSAVYDAEFYDRGANFATNQFTAPYPGIYSFRGVTVVTGLTSNHTQVIIDIKSSTQLLTTFNYFLIAGQTVAAVPFLGAFSLTSGQQVGTRLTVQGASSGADFFGSSGTATATVGSWFSGEMIG